MKAICSFETLVDIYHSTRCDHLETFRLHRVRMFEKRVLRGAVTWGVKKSG
jgi:hypothetical protein